ncbi:hypothetical protein GGF42_007012 [Coemansia sp. RSA 2424]|nr:hypothetical protein GGF42_007012 [Coemansia sp. RSA 2424]
MYPSEYSQSTDFGSQRSASSPRRSEYAQPPQGYGFSSSSLFTPGDPGGFVMPSSGHHHHMSAHCGPSPLGFINPSEHIGHNHGQQQQQSFGFNNSGYPPIQQQQLGGPGGFAIPGANYSAPFLFPPVPQPQQQQMTAYPPPAQQQVYRQQQQQHAQMAPPVSATHAHPQQPRKSVHFLPPYSAQDPYASSSEVSHSSTAVGHPDRIKRGDSVMSHSRPESVASRHSAASSLHTLVPNSPTANAQSFATPTQIGMSVYNKHSGGNHPHSSSTPPRRHHMHSSRPAAYAWEDLRYNN